MLISLLKDFFIELPKPDVLYCDNQSAIRLTKNPVFHEQTKHLEIDFAFVRERVADGLIVPLYVLKEFQLADSFIKTLHPARFQFLPFKNSVGDIHKSPS